MSNLEYLLQGINEDVAAVREALCRANITSFEEFKFQRGQLWGLMLVQERVKALIKNIEES